MVCCGARFPALDLEGPVLSVSQKKNGDGVQTTLIFAR